MHSVTDRRTDGQTDGQQAAGNSRSYCVTVRSAKNRLLQFQARSAHHPATTIHSIAALKTGVVRTLSEHVTGHSFVRL